MRKVLLICACVAMLAVVAAIAPVRSAPMQSATETGADTISFRLTFGELQRSPNDFSGSVELTNGRVTQITPWRFLDGDSVNAASSWKLQVRRLRFEDQPDWTRPMMTEATPSNVVPAGVFVTAAAPLSATARVRTAQGNFEFRLSDLAGGQVLSFLDGDAKAQLVPTSGRVNEPTALMPAIQNDYPSVAVTRAGVTWLAWQGYHNKADRVYARHTTASGWSRTFELTEANADVYRTAIAEDANNRIWVVWSERSGQRWDLYARSSDGDGWAPRRKLTSANHPNIFHRMTADRDRNLHLVWTAFRNGQSHVFHSRLAGDNWSAPREISGPSAWVPEAAADSSGNLWVTWDSYRDGNYEIYLRRVGADGALGEEQRVTHSELFQTHPTIAVDRQDRVWLAWHESGAAWGKDWTHEDPWRATKLYADRRIKIAALDGGTWKQPEAAISTAIPTRYNRYVQYPRIAADEGGRVWVGLQIRTGSGHNRSDGWAFDGRWEHFLTSLEGDHWAPAMPVPQSSSRPEGALMLNPNAKGVALAWSNDNRPLTAPAFYGPIPSRYEVFSAKFDSAATPPAPALVPFDDVEVPEVPAIHPNERDDVSRIRAYRAQIDGRPHQILRGDFHRHTEISTDGSGDGSLEDYFRYMLDAASMDTGIVGDHNIGNDDEYSWWRTEKAIDLFLIPSRYTPMFGYERSAGYPNGHRNVVFAQRGVPTLPLSREESSGKVPSGPIIYPYLRQYNGICMSHSTATSQGTDFRDWDEQLEPLVELYQGYHASYEYAGAPRAESGNLKVLVHGRYEPAGFWWNALEKGRRLGVQSSSDHISTHTAYTLIYTPSMDRRDILESMRARHAYGATDNIVVDFQAEAAGGKTYFMGDAFRANSAPALKVRIIGTDEIQKVEIIKDKKFIYQAESGEKEFEFNFVDNETAKGESYYYVRVQQRDRNLAWSSPIWVTYE